MKRSRVPLIVVLAALAALLLASCGTGRVGSEGRTLPTQSGAAHGVSVSTRDTESAQGRPNPFSTSGGKIVDAAGKEVTITGINWFGMETGIYAPHGLWARNWEDMLDQIASLGFNTIRLPYSSQLFDPDSKTGEGIDFRLNPDLKGLSGVEVMDKIVTGAGKRGLKVILDHHRSDISTQAKLWYTTQYPEERWIADWVMLAQRYKGNDTVIGADLHNEPAGDATWGTGDPKTDWRMAAEKAGNAIQEVNPDWLIIVEGIEKTNNDKDWYWMGGNLADVAKYPIELKLPNKLVYSPHDYGPEVYLQGWFKDASFPANLSSVWDSHWGYIAKQGIAPLLLGEFGGRSVGTDMAGIWQRTLVQYLKDRGIGYTYWAFNADSGDTGGVLSEDWKSVHQDKLSLLETFQSAKMPIANPAQVDTGAVPRYATSPWVTPPPIPEGQAAPELGANDPKVQVVYQAGNVDSQSSNPSIKLNLINSGAVPVKLSDLEVRYWFNPNDESGRRQILDLDWTNVGRDGIIAKIVEAGPQLDYVSLAFKDRDKLLDPNAAIQVLLRIHKDDWSKYNQADSYSFAPFPQMRAWKRVTSYVGDKLNWGVEPKLPEARTAPPNRS